MKSNSRNFLFIAALLLAVFASAGPAYAYLDPGTVSYFLQILIAGLVGLSVTIKLYWNNIVSIFKSKTPAAPPETAEKTGGAAKEEEKSKDE